MAFFCSKKEAAAFFDVSVQALDGWFTAGCPVAEHDDNGRIKSVCLDEMARWRIGRADDVRGLEAERIRLTKAQADKTELEVAELQGSLIRVESVLAHWQSKGSAARAKLLSLPSKLAAQVASPDKLIAAQDKAQALVHEALAELAGDGLPEEFRDREAAMDRSKLRSNIPAAAEADAKPVGSGKADAKPGRQRRAGKVPAE